MSTVRELTLKRLNVGSDTACGIYKCINAQGAAVGASTTYEVVTQVLMTLETDGLVEALGAVGYMLTDRGVETAEALA